MILMNYHTLILSKTRKDVKKNLLSAAVVIGALRVKIQNQQFHIFESICMTKSIRMKKGC